MKTKKQQKMLTQNSLPILQTQCIFNLFSKGSLFTVYQQFNEITPGGIWTLQPQLEHLLAANSLALWLMLSFNEIYCSTFIIKVHEKPKLPPLWSDGLDNLHLLSLCLQSHQLCYAGLCVYTELEHKKYPIIHAAMITNLVTLYLYMCHCSAPLQHTGTLLCHSIADNYITAHTGSDTFRSAGLVSHGRWSSCCIKWHFWRNDECNNTQY